MSSKNRIGAVDGLRTCAVLGVVYIHTWMFFGTPNFYVGGLNFSRAVALVGNGVDLFFVISGFCMYYMYSSNYSMLSWINFGHFVRKRWLRIAPAFYVSAFVCAIRMLVSSGVFPATDLIKHFLFINILPPNYNLAAPFWSLATEWHYYLLLPLILWGAYSRWGFKKTIIAIILLSLAFRYLIFIQQDKSLEFFWTPQIFMRIIEFLWGMVVARLYLVNRTIPRLLSGNVGFVLGLGIAYTGRMLLTTEAVRLPVFGTLFHAFAEPVMTLGFGIMIWNVISSKSIFVKILCSKPFIKIGKWSYSMYLWHWWICFYLSEFITRIWGKSVYTQHFTFIISVILLVPVSYLSYKWLESFYFNRRTKGHWMLLRLKPID